MASSPTTFAGHYTGTINTWCAAFNYTYPLDFYVDFDNKVTFVNNVTGTLAGGLLSASGAFSGGSITIKSNSLGKVAMAYGGSCTGLAFTAAADKGEFHSRIKAKLDSGLGNVGSTAGDRMVGGYGGDLLRGLEGNDTLYGAAGADQLYGEDGNDRLYGGAGRDSLAGGAGKDTFLFTQVDETGTTEAARDVVQDFLSRTDRIDLSGIDANQTTPSVNDVFSSTFVSTFTKPGQLRFENGLLEGNTDTDSAPEFSITLTGCSALNVPTDLVL